MTNPYAPPQANVETPANQRDPSELELASLLMRFLGNLLDTIFILIPFFTVVYLLGYWDKLLTEGEVAMDESIILAALSLLIFVAINGYLIYNRGQTLGKLICRTRVVMIDGSPVSGNRYLFMRYLPMYLLSQIPFAGGIISLVDALLIFRKERNCLHDDIAGTRVVVAD